jgi:hypothetical protein
MGEAAIAESLTMGHAESIWLAQLSQIPQSVMNIQLDT